MPDRFILQGEAARAALVRGMDTMTDVLALTLGPTTRMVGVARTGRNGEPPELLNSAATIARRITQITPPFADMGGMIVRHMAWRVFTTSGDGAATAAVIARRLVHEGARAIAAGGNPMRIRHGIERGLAVARAELRRQARDVSTPDELAGIVVGTVRDAHLAAMIGEIMDAVGADGSVTVERTQGAGTTYEYVDGARWNEGYVSPHLLAANEASAYLRGPRIFLTDHDLERAEQVLPAVEACVAAGARSLLVIAPRVTGAALALLIVNRERGVLEGAVAVKAPPSGTQRAEALDDIAVLTGGRAVLQARGERCADVTIADLGAARQAWATNAAFAILGGQGTREAIGQRIATLKTALRALSDEEARGQMRERIGKLTGIGAIIRVGAPTTSDAQDRADRVEAAVTAARVALREGIVPGGGSALLGCSPAVVALDCDGDEAVGVAALARALGEPLRVIAENAGLDGGAILAAARAQGEGGTYDVTRQRWVDAWEARIVDPLAVTRTALETGVSAAVMALTTEVLIRHKKPPLNMTP